VKPKAFCAALALLVVGSYGDAAEPVSGISQCTTGGVKFKPFNVSFKPKRCYLIDNEAKFKEVLQEMGWSLTALPQVKWSDELAIVDAGDAPYGNAAAKCVGITADAAKKSAAFRWAWEQKVTPSASQTRERRSDDKDGGPARSADGKTLGEQVKDDLKRIPSEAKEKALAVGEDFKKFPSPMPKRQAVVASVSRKLLAADAALECKVDK
jgi:hypothetical protein